MFVILSHGNQISIYSSFIPSLHRLSAVLHDTLKNPTYEIFIYLYAFLHVHNPENGDIHVLHAHTICWANHNLRASTKVVRYVSWFCQYSVYIFPLNRLNKFYISYFFSIIRSSQTLDKTVAAYHWGLSISFWRKVNRIWLERLASNQARTIKVIDNTHIKTFIFLTEIHFTVYIPHFF